MTDNTFVFVVGNSPGKLKANSTRKVKSHISRQGWKSHTETSVKSRKRSKQRNPTQTVRFEYQSAEEQGSDAIEAIELWMTKQLSRDFQLGGGRVDPFRAYPGEQRPYIPSLVDHYLVHMAVDIPELDQPGNKGLLRTRWFPLVLSDLSCFQTVLLLSASNAASCHHTPAGCELLQMKSEAITSINDAFSDNEKRISDAVIGAVAKMASFEAMYGSLESYRIHMNGLYRMVMLRGGLDVLGLDGLLRRIILWIDLNSAFIFNSPRYFPRLNFDGREEILEPNPERFVAP